MRNLICENCSEKFKLPLDVKWVCPKCKSAKVANNYGNAPGFRLNLSPMHPRAKRGLGNRNK